MNRLFTVTGALVASAALWSPAVRADHRLKRPVIVHEHPPAHMHVVDSDAARVEENLRWQAELAARANELVRAETAWREPAILGALTVAHSGRPTFSNPAVVIPESQLAFFRDPYYFMDGRSFDRRSLAFGINANDFYTRWNNAQPRYGSQVVYLTPRSVVEQPVVTRVERSIAGRDAAVIETEVSRVVEPVIERR